MIEIRIHGRGGQGVVTAAEILAISAFKDGQEAQAFPFFGVERTGAPVEAFARIDNKKIRVRERIYHPDYLIVQDSSLVGSDIILKGIKKNTKIIINTNQDKNEILKKLKLPEDQAFVIDATGIALKIIGKNIVNTVILGALAKATNLISLKSLKSAIKEKFNEKGKEIVEKNILALEEAYNNFKL